MKYPDHFDLYYSYKTGNWTNNEILKFIKEFEYKHSDAKYYLARYLLDNLSWLGLQYNASSASLTFEIMQKAFNNIISNGEKV